MPICQPLTANSRALLEAEARTEMRHLQGWQLEQLGGIWRISKTYATANFVQSFALTERITRLAEAEQHHPEITLAWGSCKVSWWTHEVRGVHENDVRMAAATDELLLGT